MAISLHNRNEVPPGGFRYKQLETKVEIKAPDWWTLVERVKAHRKANEIPVGLQIEQEIIDQLCSIMPPGVCGHSDPTRKIGLKKLGGFKQLLSAAETFAGWVVSGFAKVTQEEADARARTCADCQFNRSPDDCKPCNFGSIRELLDSVGSTKYDRDLEACALCGCMVRAKVHFPVELLETKFGLKAEEYPDWCWLRQRDSTPQAKEADAA